MVLQETLAQINDLLNKRSGYGDHPIGADDRGDAIYDPGNQESVTEIAKVVEATIHG